MSSLPLFKNDDQVMQLLQTKWSSQLNPILALPIISGNQATNITISSGHAAIINHLLGRRQQGWIITDQNFPANIARIQPLNDKTLTLSSDATVQVAVWMF